MALVVVDPFKPFQNINPSSSSPSPSGSNGSQTSQIVLFDPSSQQQLVHSSFFSTPSVQSQQLDIGSTFQKLNIFSSPPGSPQSPIQSPEQALTKQIPQSTMKKWKNQGFLETLENSLSIGKPPTLNFSQWTESEMNDINAFYSGMLSLLNSIKFETNEYINLSSQQLIKTIPDFIKTAVSSYPNYSKELPILYFLTDETTQNQFWSYVGENSGVDRLEISRQRAYEFITDSKSATPLTDISKIDAVSALWNKLLYSKLIELLTMAKENDGSVRILPWYYSKLHAKFTEIIGQYKLDITVEYQIKSSEQSKGIFEQWKGKLQSTVSSLASFWPFGKKEEVSFDDKTWLELQDLAFEGKKELKLKRLNNHPVLNEIYTLLEKQSKQKKLTLYETLTTSADFNIIGALLNFPSGNPILKNFIRYTKIGDNLVTSFVFTEFDNAQTHQDINPTISYFENPDNNDSPNKLTFEPNWWNNVDTKFQTKVSDTIVNIIKEFRKKGGPDPLVLTKDFGSDKNTNDAAYYNESLQTLGMILKNEAYTNEVDTNASFLYKLKFPPVLLSEDKFKEYDFDFYLNKSQKYVLNYPMNPNIVLRSNTLPPFVVRYAIQQESKLLDSLNKVFNQSIDTNKIPVINEQPFWFENNPFPNITIFDYQKQNQLTPNATDLELIGGSSFTLENLKNLFDYENIIRLNKIKQDEELAKPEFAVFKDSKNFKGSLLESWIKDMNKQKPQLTDELDLLLDKLFFESSLSMQDGIEFLKRISVSPFAISTRQSQFGTSTSTSSTSSNSTPSIPPSNIQPDITKTTSTLDPSSLLVITGPAFVGTPNTVSDFMTSKRRSPRNRRRSPKRKVRRIPRRKVVRNRRRSRL